MDRFRARTACVGMGLALGLVLVSCGGGGDGGGGGGGNGDGGGGTTLSLSAIDNEFDPTELKVPAGQEVTVEVTNDGNNAHTFTSHRLGFDSEAIQPGESASVTFTAPDKPTEFECEFHEATGMTGEIVPES